MDNFTSNLSRSNIIESSHRVKVLVTNINKKILLNSGHTNDLIYPRSAIKIFQAIPFMQSNAWSFYKLNSKIIALACSSHRGEPFHIKELQKWIDRIKISEKMLKCGIHNPLNLKASEKLFRSNKYASQIHNNCSGKHLAMITACILNKHNLNNYLDHYHPHQIEIRKIFQKFTGKTIRKENFGIDGCSAPQYCFKIQDVAEMLRNLIKSYKGQFNYNYEIKKLIDSILNHPKFIGGTDSLDSKIMQISNKNIFCKGGAEGVFLFIDLNKEIVGIIKVVDGNERVIPSIIFNIFKKLKIMNSTELKKLMKYYDFNIVNHAKIKVGSIKTII
mgnify:CR=1 FL=1